jgi:formate dehydrogenase
MINPDDAAAHGLGDGDLARLWNGRGEIIVEAAVTTEVSPGTLCYPHGWGHRGGWQTANRVPGANINTLLDLGVDGVEFVSGTSLLDGIEVSIERCGSRGADTAVARR